MERPIYPGQRAGIGRVVLKAPQLTTLVMASRPGGVVCGIRAKPATKLAQLGLIAVVELMDEAVRICTTKRGDAFVEGYRRLRRM
jgi:hypothetical protein